MSETTQSQTNERPGSTAFAEALENDRTKRAKAKSIKPLRAIWPFIAAYPGLLTGFAVFLILAASFTLLMPMAGRILLDCGFGDAAGNPLCQRVAVGNPAHLSSYFRLAMVFSLALGMASALRFYFVSVLGQRVIADVRKVVYQHILDLSPGFYEKVRTGEVLSRLTTDTTLVESVIGSSVSFALRTIVTTIGGVLLMFLVSWKLALMVVIIGSGILIPLMLVGQRIQRLSRDTQDRLAEASGRAGESLAAIQTVQAYTREPEERARFDEAVENTFAAARKRLRIRSLMTGFVTGAGLVSLISIMWFGASQVSAGVLSAGTILQFALLAMLSFSGAGFLAETWTEMLRAAGAAERIMALLEEKPDIKAPDRPRAITRAIGALRFEDVTFSYPSRPQEQALKGFTCGIAPGERVALVGPSGAGKSTVFQLLLRFYDPQRGQLVIDDAPYTAFDPVDIRRQLAVVQQNTPLFSGTALDNIRYGRPDASFEDVIAAAKAAFAHDFIENLPDAYDTELGEQAVTLSGGQRQRLAIARAILRDAPVLLLDEATSALDAESEKEVQRAFSGISKDRTTLVIAHRLATVMEADRILVMDGGRIVEEGTHEALIARDGLYARLAKLQLNKA